MAAGERQMDYEMTSKNATMKQMLRELRRRQGAMVKLLGEFVRCESPSHDKGAVDRCGKFVAREWKRRGAGVRILGQRERGNHLRAEIWLGRGEAAGQVMVLGHLDTVYPLGTLAKMPFRLAGGRAWGPGTFDMKGGLVLALFAVDALRAAGIALRSGSFFCGLRMKRLAARVRGGRSSRKRGGVTRCWCWSQRLEVTGV